jgi:hypothetical protein
MDEDERLWKVLVSVRVGSTLTDDPAGGDWPKPKHVNDAFRAVPRLDRDLGHLMDVAYSRLYEAVHPSVGAQAALWRLGGTGRLQPYVLRLEPRRSQSPTKVDVVAAVSYSASAVTQFARYLWWVATDVSLAFRLLNMYGWRERCVWWPLSLRGPAGQHLLDPVERLLLDQRLVAGSFDLTHWSGWFHRMIGV